MQLTEVTRNAAWIFVLLKLIGLRLQGTDHILASNRWIPWFALRITLILVALLGAETLGRTTDLRSTIFPCMQASVSCSRMPIVGLLLLEQFFRNSNEGELWATKHLCLGLGIMFAYDFFMYAEALLFRQLDQDLWQARGHC